MRQRSLKSLQRAAEAAEKRRVREAKAHERERARLAKEQEKLDDLESARAEVEAFNARLDELLSVHREDPVRVDWMAVAASLPPPPPIPSTKARARAEQFARMVTAGYPQFSDQADLERAGSIDAADSASAMAEHQEEVASWRQGQRLATRILDGDLGAYREAVGEWDPFEESPTLHAKTSVAVESGGILDCFLSIKGLGIIPDEMKALTSTGKLSQKAMPKRQFNELYEDYVCGCVLRVGRDLMAFLPVPVVLVTACVETDDPMGARGVVPILSVELNRSTLDKIDWGSADASDAIEQFRHVGDARSSHKSGFFEPIEPIEPSQIEGPPAGVSTLGEGLRQARALLRDLEAELDRMTPTTK